MNNSNCLFHFQWHGSQNTLSRVCTCSLVALKFCSAAQVRFTSANLTKRRGLAHLQLRQIAQPPPAHPHAVEVFRRNPFAVEALELLEEPAERGRSHKSQTGRRIQIKVRNENSFWEFCGFYCGIGSQNPLNTETKPQQKPSTDFWQLSSRSLSRPWPHLLTEKFESSACGLNVKPPPFETNLLVAQPRPGTSTVEFENY